MALPAELIRDFLRATEGLPPAESAALAGVAEATYLRWRRQPPRVVREAQRLRIERYLSAPEPEVWLG